MLQLKNNALCMTHWYPVGINVVRTIDIIQGDQFDARIVVWKDVSETVFGPVTLHLRLLCALISSDEFQILRNKCRNYNSSTYATSGFCLTAGTLQSTLQVIG